jgi:hypothetical protein
MIVVQEDEAINESGELLVIGKFNGTATVLKY